MEFEDSREGPATKNTDYKSALSRIDLKIDRELSKAREYVKSQIKPFARQCVQEGSDLGLSDLKPTFSNFYQYVKDDALRYRI